MLPGGLFVHPSSRAHRSLASKQALALGGPVLRARHPASERISKRAIEPSCIYFGEWASKLGFSSSFTAVRKLPVFDAHVPSTGRRTTRPTRFASRREAMIHHRRQLLYTHTCKAMGVAASEQQQHVSLLGSWSRLRTKKR